MVVFRGTLSTLNKPGSIMEGRKGGRKGEGREGGRQRAGKERREKGRKIG